MPRRRPIRTDEIAARLKEAHATLRAVGRSGSRTLTQALLLQGILSGDQVSAAIAERQRLQRENLRLRQRLTHARLRTERAKAVILENAGRLQPKLAGDELMQHIAEIYGMDWKPRAALTAHAEAPPTGVIEAEVIPNETRADTPQDLVAPSAARNTTACGPHPEAEILPTPDSRLPTPYSLPNCPARPTRKPARGGRRREKRKRFAPPKPPGHPCHLKPVT